MYLQSLLTELHGHVIEGSLVRPAFGPRQHKRVAFQIQAKQKN